MDIPQRLSINSFRLSADKQQLLLLVTDVEEVVEQSTLIKLYKNSPYTYLKLNKANLEKAVLSFARLKTDTKRSGDLESVAIAEVQDAQLTITVDNKKMSAKAQIISSYGGLQISLEYLQSEIEALGINTGVSANICQLLVDKSKQAKPGSVYQATIAKGTPAVDGIDAQLKRLVETPKERLLKPQEISNSRVDMRNLGELLTVKPGDQLIRKVAMVDGKDGIDIFAQVVDHKPPKDIELQVGDNTEIADFNQNLLIATIAGIPKNIKDGMEVDDVLTVQDVDVGFGHVNYEGSVIINGNICDGMKVSATGDITVQGFVESAEIHCGGDLIVSNGILGHQSNQSHEYTCVIDCNGSLVANISQYSKLTVGEDMHIKSQLTHCDVNCKGDINVMDDSGLKGTIIGGHLSGFSSINTVNIGSTAGTKTSIDLIGSYQEITNESSQIKEQKQEQENKLLSVSNAQRKVAMLPADEKRQLLETRLSLTKEEAKKELNAISELVTNNEQAMLDYYSSATVCVSNSIHPETLIEIGRYKMNISRTHGPSKIMVKDYNITIEPFTK